MKKAIFTIGLIAGILGILANGLLIMKGFGMPAYDDDTWVVLKVSAIVILVQIAGLIFSVTAEKNPKLFGVFILVAGLLNYFTLSSSILIDLPASFLIGAIAGILFIIAGVMSLTQKKKENVE